MSWDRQGAEWLQRGTTTIDTSISVTSGRRLAGVGPDSVLKADASLTTALLLGLSATAAQDVVISDLTLDLSAIAEGTSVRAIQMTNAAKVRLVRVHIVGAPDAAALFTTCDDVRLIDCTIESYSGGVRFNVGSTDCRVVNSTIRDELGKCVLVASNSLRCRAVGNDLAITGNGQECIGFEAGCHDGWAVDNYCVGSPIDNCIGLTGDRSHIIGNTVASTGRHGISVGDGTTVPYNMIVQGNVVSNAGQDGTAAWAGVVLQGAMGAIVTGNRVTGCDEYGIKGNTENYCVVQGNDLRGNVTTATQLSGANNSVSGNLI